MAIAEYRLKAVPVFAEQVPQDIASILEVADRWGAEVTVSPTTGVTVTLVQGRARDAKYWSAKPGEWLLDRAGEGKGCCTNDEFVASFEAVA